MINPASLPVKPADKPLPTPNLLETPRIWLGRKVSACMNWMTNLCQKIASWALSFFWHTTSPFHPVFRLAIGRVSLSASSSTFDPTMQDLQTFLTNLSTLLGTSVYNKIVAPAVQGYLANAVLPALFLDFIENISLLLAKTVASEMTSVFDNALASGTSEVKLLITWMFYGDKAQDIKSLLLQTLKGKYQAQTSSQPDLLDKFVNWLGDKSWLTSSSNIPSPLSICDSKDKDLIQSLLLSSLQTLISNKIKAFIQNICAALAADTGSILKDGMVNNSTIIGKAVSLRFASLLQATAPLKPSSNLPTIYQKSYNQVVTLLYNQVEAIVQASKSSKDTASLDAAFSRYDVCDPNIQAMLNPPAGTDPNQYRQDLETKLCNQTAVRLLALLLPDQKSEQGGLSISTPGCVILLRSIVIPPAILQTYHTLVSWPEELFPNGPPASVELLASSVQSFLEKGVASILNDQILFGLSLGLQQGLNYVVPPEYLSMWMVQGAFPAIFQALVQSILSNVLLAPSDEVVNAFLPFLNANCNRAAAYPQLTPILYTQVFRATQEVDLQKAGMNEVAFAESVIPYLDQVIDYLLQNIPPDKRNTGTVKTGLYNYNQPVQTDPNGTYGKLLTDLMVQVGNLKFIGNQDLAGDVCKLFLQHAMSKAVTQALFPLQSNEQLLVGGILTGLKVIMSTQPEVDQLLFGPPPQVVDVSSQLALQIDQTSGLIDSLVRQVVSQLPNHSHWYSSPFKKLGAEAIKQLLPPRKDLTTAMTKVYGTILGNRYLNENLYLQIVNVILKAWDDANNTLST